MIGKKRPVCILATVAVFSLAACSLSGCSVPGSDPEPAMDVYQASKRINALLDETFAGVHPRLKWRDGPAETSGQDDILGRPNGSVTVSRTRYVRNEVSKGMVKILYGAVEKHWEAAGYKIGDVNAKEPSFTGMTPDGFSIRFSVGASGNVYFDASSPSAKYPGYSGGAVTGEEGDEFPKGSGGGRDVSPDVHDSYWSK
ncbi:hypothetical protein [Streptomyces sp. NEAU-S7GS2]|uniref:hypothetical protein n=1 Tax=Streptomyces sp. NEAU-S7GS2 TaxID=2202000 RepID=UPI0013A5323E|nr:hypothetical protein [Streptomyces sp. NEAU-S7GS2]